MKVTKGVLSEGQSSVFSADILRRALILKTTLLVSALVLVLGGALFVILTPSSESLLDSETLTPAQIRVIANSLLLHDDMKIRAKASAKLLSAGNTAVPVLKEIAVSASDPKLRLSVLALLISLDPVGSVDVFGRLMADTDQEVRASAVAAAAQLGGPHSVPILENALKDPVPRIRDAAAAALASSVNTADARTAADSLKVSLNDPNMTVRRHAVRALRNITGVDYSDKIGKSRP